MSDETPAAESEEAPTEPVPASEGGASGAGPRRYHIEAPRWLALVVAALLLLGGGFAIGRVTDSGEGGDHQDRNAADAGERGPRRGFPRLPGIPGGGQLPGGGRVPSGFPGGQGGQGQAVSRAFLGVAVQDASGGQQGVQVTQVAANGPAAAAGLQAGDVITAVDNTPVSSTAQLRQLVSGHSPGDKLTVTYSRGGSSVTATVTVGDRSQRATTNS